MSTETAEGFATRAALAILAAARDATATPHRTAAPLTLRPISRANALPNRPTFGPSINIDPSAYVVERCDIAPTVEVPLPKRSGRHERRRGGYRSTAVQWAVVGDYGRRGAETLSWCETCDAPIAEGDLVVAESAGYVIAPTVEQNHAERGWDHMRCRHDLFDVLAPMVTKRPACKPAAPRKAPKDYAPTSITLAFCAAEQIVTALAMEGNSEAQALATELNVGGYPPVRGAGSTAVLKAVGATRALALAAEALR